MSAPRRAKQRDANEPDIVAAFRRFGWLTVQHDTYDLEVQCPRCQMHMSVEVKNPKGRNRTTASQDALRVAGWILPEVRDVGEVLKLITAHMLERDEC